MFWQVKEAVVAEMQSERVRMLIATEAYSMGTDCNNIRRIIHTSPPSAIESKNELIWAYNINN